MKIEYVNGCTVSDIMIDGESFADCSDTKWGIMRQMLLKYLSKRVQNDDALQDLLIWSCERFGDTRRDRCEQCGDDIYATTLEL